MSTDTGTPKPMSVQDIFADVRRRFPEKNGFPLILDTDGDLCFAGLHLDLIGFWPLEAFHYQNDNQRCGVPR